MSMGAAHPPFAQLLWQTRGAAGLTQEELAERARVSWRAVSDLERGVRLAPRRETVTLLADGLGLAGEERAAFEYAGRRGRQPHPAQAVGAPASGQSTTPGPPRGALPAALATLVGRAAEQAAVRALLSRARLVTLTGSAGVGKTRLALAVAADPADAASEGAWLIELAALGDPALVPGEVARVLGLREELNRPTLATLIDHLQYKQLLLVLDNCEHLVEACAALVAALLRVCPSLSILATSREPLGVSGERRYRVPSLSVPLPEQHSPGELLACDAVRLFVDRAEEHQADFVLTSANAPAVAELCRRLDGIPLAIELAAARVGSLPVEAIAARLDDRFALLTTGARSAPRRHKTLRAALDWSYDLLSPPERALLNGLAVFAGGCTLEAAAAVLDFPQAPDAAPRPEAPISEDVAILDLFDALGLRSLVQQEQGRYWQLETIRAYAADRLAAQEQGPAHARRHAHYYLGLAEAIRPGLTGPEQGLGLARLDAEHDNLRAALRWAHEQGEGAPARRLAAALWRFWYLRGHLREGRAWLESAPALPGDDGDAVDTAARAAVAHGGSVLAWTQGDHAQAVTLAQQALDLWRRLGDQAGAAATLNLLGLVAIDQDDWERAVTALEESLTLRRALRDQWGIATSLHNLGTVARGRSDYARAAALYAESLALRAVLGDAAGMAISYRDQGALAAARDDHAGALALFRESLRHAESLGDLAGVAQCLEGLAAVADRQARAEPAAQLLGAAAAVRERVGVPAAPAAHSEGDRLAASLRAKLGAAYEGARTAGRAVPWADLVEQAFG